MAMKFTKNILAAGAGVGLLALLLAGCGGSTAPPTASQPQPTIPPTSVPTPTVPAAPRPTGQYKIGDVVSTMGYVVILHTFGTSPPVPDTTITPGKRHVYASVTIGNKTDQAVDFSAYGTFFMQTVDGRQVSQIGSMEPPLHSTPQGLLMPYGQLQGDISFEVDAQDEDFILVFQPDWGHAEHAVTWQLHG